MRAVLDSSALLALLLEEAGAEQVEAMLDGCLISVVNVAEVAATLARHFSVEEVKSILADSGPVPVAADEEMAIDAGLLRPVTDVAGLSLADRFCLALGRRLGVPVVTADKAWARVAESAAVEVLLIR
ncbi:MAG TPA: PIN domain-containing protein [Allosphingosinicella sp.]